MVIHKKEKKERALGEKLFLKAFRSQSPKSAMIRRPYRPGVHGKSRHTTSDYGAQLKAKQKLKLSYGVNEHQLKKVVREAVGIRGNTAYKILELLEQRLDNAVFRSGLAPSRIMARNFVSRGHLMVNGRKTVSPSFKVRIGDVISVRMESREKNMFRDLRESLEKATSAPTWLSVTPDKLEAKITGLPQGVEETLFNVGAVVEFYSK